MAAVERDLPHEIAFALIPEKANSAEFEEPRFRGAFFVVDQHHFVLRRRGAALSIRQRSVALDDLDRDELFDFSSLDENVRRSFQRAFSKSRLRPPGRLPVENQRQERKKYNAKELDRIFFPFCS